MPTRAAVGEDEHLRAGALRRRPCERTIVTSATLLAARERVRGGREDFFVQTSTSIFAFFFSACDEGVGVLLLLLLGQELLDPRAAPVRTEPSRPDLWSVTLMMW